MHEARKLAANEGTTCVHLVEQGLRHVVGENRKEAVQMAARDYWRPGLRPELKTRLGLKSSICPTSVGPIDRRRFKHPNLRAKGRFAISSGAIDRLRELVEGTAGWAIPWPCIHEFLSVVTNRRCSIRPTSLNDAIGFATSLINSPSLVLLAETESIGRRCGRLQRRAA